MGRNPTPMGRPPPEVQPSCYSFSQHRQVAPRAMHCAPWALGTQAPPEAPWAMCLPCAVWAPLLAAGMVIQMETLLLSSAQPVEAEL